MTQSTEQERAEFKAWLGIKPCGAAHDLAWSAWKAARRAQVVPQGWQDLAKRCLVAMETAVHFRKTGEGRPPEQTCLFEIEELRAALAAAPQPPDPPVT